MGALLIQIFGILGVFSIGLALLILGAIGGIIGFILDLIVKPNDLYKHKKD